MPQRSVLKCFQTLHKNIMGGVFSKHCGEKCFFLTLLQKNIPGEYREKTIFLKHFRDRLSDRLSETFQKTFQC